jgi:putative phosphoesterase
MKTLIVSDIHANLSALTAVLEIDGDYDNFIFLGDVVDYGPHPKECLAYVKEHANYYVRGNHDNALGYDVDCNCMGTFREYSIATREWHKTLLDDDDKRFLRNMPILAKAHINGNSFFLAHASPQGDLFKYIKTEDIDDEIKNIFTEYILLGHTHIQFKKKINESLVVNPGSVGLARDGGQACYAIYHDGEIKLKRINYDVEKTITDLMSSPTPKTVKEGLKTVLLSHPR